MDSRLIKNNSLLKVNFPIN